MTEIFECTPRRLFLRKSERDIRLFLLCGVGMLLVDCLIFYAAVRTVSVRCARGPAGLTCDVTENLLGIIPLDRRRVEHVEGASVGATGASDPSSQVELETATDHEMPLSSITENEWQCSFFVGRFNDFVRSGQSAADFLQLPDLILMVMLSLLLVIPLVCFVLAQPYRLEIDRDLACLTIRDGFIRRTSHPLADVDDVRVEERQDDGRTIREVFLLLKGGKRVQLAIEPDLVDLVGDYVPQQVS